VLGEHPSAGGFRDASQLGIGQIERGQHLLGRLREQDLLARTEEGGEPVPIVGHDRDAAGRRLEQPARRAPPHRRHVAARDVQRQPRGTEKRRVSGRRDMVHEIDVGLPREVGGVARSAEHEATLGRTACGLHEQPDERCLPIVGVGAEIGKVAPEQLDRRDGPVGARIDMAVERRRPTRAEPVGERVERRTAGVAQHQVEAAQPRDWQIVDRLACGEPRERDGRVEIVEDRSPPALRLDQRGRGVCVGTVGGDDHGVGVDEPTLRRQHLRPLTIQEQASARQVVQVAAVAVPGHVAFDEDDLMAVRRQRVDQAAPQGRMAIPPGRADGQPEHDDLQACAPCRFHPGRTRQLRSRSVRRLQIRKEARASA
jgi:hypothetical protein